MCETSEGPCEAAQLAAALRESHEKIMVRLESWLEAMETKLRLEPQGSPLGGSDRSLEAPRPPVVREPSESSYDLAKKAASKIEIHKNLHSMTMQSGPKQGYLTKLCPHWKHVQSNVAAIVKSNKFELFFAAVLVTNSLYIGGQLQYMSTSRDPAFQPTFVALHIAFACFFTLECALCFIGYGLRAYLFSADWFWGWLDVLVVISAWVELALDLASDSSTASNTGVRIIKVFKFTRLLQGLRSLRIVRFVGGLRILVYSMLDATKSLVWALVLLGLVVYVFGVVFANAALDYLLFTDSGETFEKMNLHWGSVDTAIATLCRSILGGLDWGEAADALRELSLFWVQVFHFYIGFVCLLILNVMTGVFCNSAIRAAERDHDIMMQNRHRFRSMATNLFQKMDDTGYGQITISEFEKLFEDEDMQAFLDSIEISATDAWTLFASLDVDGDQTISVEEFTEGCLKLHGPARSVDLYALRQQHVKMQKQIQKLSQLQNRIAEGARAKTTLLSF